MKDAIETLGKVLGDAIRGAFHDVKLDDRDAVHVGVIAVEARDHLMPGMAVTADGRMALGTADPEAVGIADPFLTLSIRPGQWFWLMLFPRTITGLAHVWSHPAFPDKEPDIRASSDKKKIAEAWLRNYAEEIDEGFHGLLSAAKAWVDDGEHYYGPMEHGYHGKFEGVGLHPDFWDYYEAYTGEKVMPEDRHSFFTCSC